MTRGKVYPLDTISALPKTAISKKSRSLTFASFFSQFYQRSSSFSRRCFTRISENSWDSESNFILSWHLSVSLAWLYNMWVIPLRWAFQLDSSRNWIYTNPKLWIPLDYISDLLYVIDTFYVAPRIQVLDRGSIITDMAELRSMYRRNKSFSLNLLSVVPTDLLFLTVNWHNGWWQLLRLNRILKFHTYFFFVNKCEQTLHNPHVFRLAKTFIQA